MLSRFGRLTLVSAAWLIAFIIVAAGSEKDE
jgi:hypothetical protein